MPELTWIGKDKVINHHLDVPFRTLERQYSFDEKGEHKEDNGSANMIIHGDNLEALKALLPKYERRVDCIYIDVPYNTGNEGWCYNDNVNDPKIKKWIGEVVGKEGDDLTRHDKWLCMMYPRLRMLQKLLKEDGVLVISINHFELFNLLPLLKELFSTYQIHVVTVQTSGGKPSGGFNYVHEYLVYIVPKDFEAKICSYWGGNERTPFEGLTLSTFDKTQRPNQVYPIFVDKNGICTGIGKSLQEKIADGEYTGKKEDYTYDYSIAPEAACAIWPITSSGKECVWRLKPESFNANWEKGYIKITKNTNAKSPNKYSIQYLPGGVIEKVENHEIEILGHEEKVPTLILGENHTVGSQIPTILNQKEFYTVKGTQELKSIFPEKAKVFDYPKPLDLISAILQSAVPKDGIVLDSFAGSGTTAHAVLNLNNKDGGKRKFILVEMMDYADSVTAERVKRTITGYKYKPEIMLMDKELSFKDLLMGQELYDDALQIVEDNKGKYDKIEKPKIVSGHLIVKATPNKEEKQIGIPGSFSYYELGPTLFLENGSLNPEIDDADIMEYVWYSETGRELKNTSGAYLGKHNNIGYYFFRNKTFNYKVLATIKDKAESYVVYAEKCAFSEEELSKYNITFKKIPRDIRRV